MVVEKLHNYVSFLFWMTKIADQMGVEVKEDAWTEKMIKKKKIRNEKTEFFE